MIKVIVKEDRNKNSVNVKYKSVKSDTLEHIIAMCSLYKEIKKNTNCTDEEIFSSIVEYFKGGEE